MAILGVITNAGLSAAQSAAASNGYNIVPTNFGVSDVTGTLNASRTSATSGEFYKAPVSSRVIIDQNTIKFVLTTPPNQIPTGSYKTVREVYLYINDINDNEILFAVGQPTDSIQYNYDQELTLDIELSIVNLNLVDNFQFSFTQATEISDHNTNPASHPEIITAIHKAGIIIPAGSYTFERRGQNFEDNGGAGVEFDGTKPSFTYGGVTFTATFNGTELNGKTIVFDGTQTTDQVRSAFNAINYPNTVEHDGTGSEVLGASTQTLTGGTYVVQDKDIVYLDTDGVYKQAIADGTIKSRVAGVAFRADKLIVTRGLIDINTGYNNSDPIYLSGDTSGKFTNFDTNINLGLSLGTFIYFTGFGGDISANVSQDFNAVVTNAAGLGQYSSTQDAINAVNSDGRILIAKLEPLKSTLDTLGKNLTIVFNGPNTGWEKFAGLSSQFRLDFDSVPTQGTFRIEWNSQETNDIPYDATASEIQDAFNLLEGSNGWVVTGDFLNGFVFTSNDLNTYTLPTFSFAGQNDIQKFEFSNVPDDGTITFQFEGENTLNYAWNDTTSYLQSAFVALSGINSVTVTGSFADQYFQIEFDGSYLQSGNQPQSIISVFKTDLSELTVSTDVNGTTIVPIDATRIQIGKTPASNLYNGTTQINITVTQVQLGEQPGPDRAMDLTSDNISITGMGKISNFSEGISFDSSVTNLELEAYFPNTTKPLLTLDRIPGVNYDIEAHGFAKDVFSQLRITEHPTNKKRIVITGADQILASGIVLSQEINNLLMKFDGAQIDFSADPIVVYESDGVTALGQNITRPSITPTKYRWFSVNIIPFVNESDQSLKAQILLLPAADDGTTLDNAPKPPFGNKPIGLAAIQGALGNKEVTQISTVKDEYGSLSGKTMILYYPTESVAFWVSDPSLDTYSSLANTGVTGTNQDLLNSTSTQVLAGEINVASPITINTIYLYLEQNGSPTGNISVRILGDNAGEPDLTNVVATATSTIDMGQVPTNFNNPVVVELTANVNLTAGVYYVEINGENLVLTAGNSLGWNSYDNGSSPEIFNRNPASSTWSTTLGTRTANFELVYKAKGIPTLAQGATRNIEVTTITQNDLQSVVASKFNAFINADADFTSTVNTNKITVTNNLLGEVTDADMGDTGFIATVTTQGTDTDATGIEDISNYEIRQLSTGAGSGGGGGNTTSFLEDIKARLRNSLFKFVTPSDFLLQSSDEIDATNTTAFYNSANNTYKFTNIGDTLRTINELGSRFLGTSTTITDEANFDLAQVEIIMEYSTDAEDLTPTVTVSRDGGNEFQAVTMTQVGLSGKLRGLHTFSDEASNQTLMQYDVSNADSARELTDSGADEALAIPMTIADKMAHKVFSLYVTKTGTPSGTLYLKFVRDNGGLPSTDPSDIVSIVPLQDITAIGSGDQTLAVDVGRIITRPGTYWVMVITDQEYKTSFSTGVTSLALRSDTSTPADPNSATYNGTTWSLLSNEAFVYLSEGMSFDLRLNIVGTTADAELIGEAMFYCQRVESTVTAERARYVERIDGGANVTTFSIPSGNFMPDPEKLNVYIVELGQVFKFPAFDIQGQNIVFKSGDLLVPGETLTIIFDQTVSGAFDNSDLNRNLFAANHLGNTDPTNDLSSNGRGIYLRRPDGTLREITIDNDDNIAIYSV